MSNVNQSQHLVIWRDIMTKIHQNLAIKDFEMPSTVEKAKVCKISGKRARSGCPSVTDYFDKESLGDGYCTSHKGYSGVVFSSGSSSSGTSSSSSYTTRKKKYSSSSNNSSSRENSDNSDNTNSNNVSDNNSANNSSSENTGGSSDSSAGTGEASGGSQAVAEGNNE